MRSIKIGENTTFHDVKPKAEQGIDANDIQNLYEGIRVWYGPRLASEIARMVRYHIQNTGQSADPRQVMCALIAKGARKDVALLIVKEAMLNKGMWVGASA
jgi:hypothetical protein